MKRLAFCVLFLIPGIAQHAAAAGIVRIADGDCAALSAGAASAPGQEPSLIVLARNGSYNCVADLSCVGRITHAGAGAHLGMGQGGRWPAPPAARPP